MLGVEIIFLKNSQSDKYSYVLSAVKPERNSDSYYSVLTD